MSACGAQDGSTLSRNPWSNGDAVGAYYSVPLMNLEGLTSCSDLTKEHADEAARSVTALRALLVWAAEVATPGAGAPNVLRAIARLGHANWVEGTPCVEISADEDASTKIEIYADHGMGIRERIVPSTRLRASIDEFAHALHLAPALIAPFHVEQRDAIIVLVLAEAGLEDARESIKIADSSLHEQERKTAPPPPPTEGLNTTAPPAPLPPGVHTHPTVRRMVAVRPEALRGGVDDTDWE